MPPQRPQQARGRASIPRPREAARAPTAPVEERRPPSQPQEGIRIVEGGKLRPSRGVASGAKGKGKVVASLGVPPLMERPTSPPSLEALMSDLLLFEEPLLKDLDEER